MPSDHTPFGWGDFDIDADEPQGWERDTVEIPRVVIPERITEPLVPVDPGVISAIFASGSEFLEWLAVKIPARYLLRDEVDELTMRGASILLVVLFLSAILLYFVFYGGYRWYKNRIYTIVLK